MTEEIKNRVKESIEYDNDDRVALFLNNFRIVSTEMKLQMDLKDKNLHFVLFFQDEISTFMISLSFLINFIMSISLQKGYITGSSTPQYSHDMFFKLMAVLQLVQVVGYVTSLVQTLILVAPVARDEWYQMVEVIAATSNQQLSAMERMRSVFKHYIPLLLTVIAGLLCFFVYGLDWFISTLTALFVVQSSL